MVVDGFQLRHVLKLHEASPEAPTPMKYQFTWYWFLTGVPTIKIAGQIFATANEEIRQWLTDTFGLSSRLGPWWIETPVDDKIEFKVGFTDKADAMLFKLRFG